jgi:pimeloyl-ACP methyl ester carboxylesterase
MHIDGFDTFRRTVRTRSADLSYVDIGEGPAALFVHGVGTNAYLWRNVIEQLAGDHRCIAIDLPLHGRSPARAAQDFSLGALASIVAKVCDALGLGRIDLVANDTGGAIAQIFAARHPERLRTFVLTNCETHDNVPPAAFKPTVDLARAGQLAPSAPALLSDLTTARTVVFGTGYEDIESLTTDMAAAFLEPVIGTPATARQFERFLAGLEPSDLLAVEHELARLTVPTLVIWGTGDEFFELKWAYWLRDTIPGVVDVVELEGARLFFPDERAAELAPLLREHWAAT